MTFSTRSLKNLHLDEISINNNAYCIKIYNPYHKLLNTKNKMI